ESGLVNALYNLWDRNPVTVRASYVASGGAQEPPPRTKLPSY
ncbi:MAG: serine/threonine protein phosphatase, partial [Deltaproteobacteria bacterium]